MRVRLTREYSPRDISLRLSENVARATGVADYFPMWIRDARATSAVKIDSLLSALEMLSFTQNKTRNNIIKKFNFDKHITKLQQIIINVRLQTKFKKVTKVF